MHPPCPADELSDLRAEIARLQAREAVLCAAFLRDPATHALGRFFRIEVAAQLQSGFDISKLPDHLRDNSTFYRETLVQTVRCLPLTVAQTARPGWPIRRPQPGATALH